MLALDLSPDELVVDSFAGGGGASTGIGWAIGRDPDVAVNHDPAAIAMHRANHPSTKHYCQNIWQVDPREACTIGGRLRPVGLAWFSPDCKHFSKAKGGAPVEKRIRDLAWVVVHWAKLVKPRIIALENVEEFKDWGPLVETEGGKMMPCQAQKGIEFRRWIKELKREGYRVEYRELRAMDYGAPTVRKRLFVIARRDGKPIIWPQPSHGPGRGEAYRTAAECIDWSLPCHSIFLSREEGKKVGVKRPLAPATMRRIARGVMRYVVNSAKPFIVPVNHSGDSRVHDIDDPLRTVTASRRAAHAVVTPYLAGVGGRMSQSGERPVDRPYHTSTAKADTVLVAPVLTKFRRDNPGRPVDQPLPTITANSFIKRPGGGSSIGLAAATLVQTGYGEREGQAPRSLDIEAPLGTAVAGGVKHALVAAFLAKHNGGNEATGQPVQDPMATVVAVDQKAVVASSLVKLRNNCTGQPTDEPLDTITGSSRGARHFGEVRAFLTKYYGTDQDPQLDEPMHTTTTKDRFTLVTVNIDGVTYAIADIGMRMLTPRELFKAQGFPSSYDIEPELDGKPLTRTAQIRACGNSVCPPVAEAIVRANLALPASAAAGAAD